MRAWLTLALGLLALSCSGVQKLQFHVSAIDANEKEIPCKIFFNGEPVVDQAHQPILTPAWVVFPFNANKLEEEISVSSIETGIPSTYTWDSRFVRPSDAKRLLFILRKKKAEAPNESILGGS